MFQKYPEKFCLFQKYVSEIPREVQSVSVVSVSEIPREVVSISEIPREVLSVSEIPRKVLSVSEMPRKVLSVSEIPREVLLRRFAGGTAVCSSVSAHLLRQCVSPIHSSTYHFPWGISWLFFRMFDKNLGLCQPPSDFPLGTHHKFRKKSRTFFLRFQVSKFGVQLLFGNSKFPTNWMSKLGVRLVQGCDFGNQRFILHVSCLEHTLFCFGQEL